MKMKTLIKLSIGLLIAGLLIYQFIPITAQPQGNPHDADPQNIVIHYTYYDGYQGKYGPHTWACNSSAGAPQIQSELAVSQVLADLRKLGFRVTHIVPHEIFLEKP